MRFLIYFLICFCLIFLFGRCNKDGILVKSCWTLDEKYIMSISEDKQKEWEERIETLKQQIQYWIDNPTEKTIEIIELFY